MYENMSILQLAMRLNEIIKEQSNTGRSTPELDEEYNAIVYELWGRIPNLKDDENIQPKKRRLIKDEKNES